MKRLMIAAGAVGIGGMVFVAATPASRSQPVQSSVAVQVDLTCTATGVQFSIDPWVVRINQGDEVEWVLDPGADSDEIEITPKRGQWPFEQQSHRGNKQDRARTGNMRPNQSGRFQYNITLTCNQGEQFEVVIDPDIIIN